MAPFVFKRSANNNMATLTSTVRGCRRSMILSLVSVSCFMFIFIHFDQKPNDCISSQSSSSSLLLDYSKNANTTTTTSTSVSIGQQQQQQPDVNATSSFTACLKNVLENLPIGKGRRAKKRNPYGLNIVAAHHYDANNMKKWNAGDRFLPMPQLQQQQSSCIVWEVGAHKKAEDSATLLKTYPNCTYHAFEPIPAYFNILQGIWKQESRMHTHNFGIGAHDEILHVNPDSLQEQATYIGDSSAVAVDAATSSSSSFVQVQIKSFANAMAETASGPPTLLHMNCEGCEWDVLPQGMDVGFIQQIPIIQIGFHNYGHEHGLGGRIWQLCEIRQRLAQTHTMIQSASVPFAWERWILSSSQSTTTTTTTTTTTKA